uniref:Uncharacterized protein n=1 Tax=Melopsittacus undulatus TaxID=13146 RepID=A0A8C6NAM5_MELUD
MVLGLCLPATFLLLLGESAGDYYEGAPLLHEGSHITLWHKVSGYQGPSEQNFQWSIYLPSAPEREVQIVSTVDPSFPYAIYTQRVRSRGIYVERVQGGTILLHITDLDRRHSASMAPQVLTSTEGDVIELTCEVSKLTSEHTYLSVDWYHLHGAGEHRSEEVLTLSKDFVLKPGPSYMQRFLSGNVQLNKIGSTIYGIPLCFPLYSRQCSQAGEKCEQGCLAHSLLLLPPGRSISMDIAVAKSSLSEGDALQLNCMVGAEKSNNRLFQVFWLLNSMEVAKADPHWVLILEAEYEERVKMGQLQSFKQSNKVHVLTIYEVGLKDNGTYCCSVSEVKTPGDFHSIHTILSSDIQVNWWHLPPQHPGPRVLVTTIEQDGTLSLGSACQDSRIQGSLWLEKASSGAFTLVIPNTLDEDNRGQYVAEAVGMSCMGRKVAWGRISVLVPKALSSRVGLGLFELICQVSSNYTLKEVPVSVRWFFQPSLSGGHYQELDHRTMACGTAQPYFQGKALLTKPGISFRLPIHSAVHANNGSYLCEVEVWRKSTLLLGPPAAPTMSNNVGINVVLPGKQCLGCFFSRDLLFCDFKSIKHDWGNQDQGYPWESLAGRLYLHYPAANDFNLTLHSVEEGDAGLYYCWIQEWQQESKGKDWVLKSWCCFIPLLFCSCCCPSWLPLALGFFSFVSSLCLL